MTEQIKPDFNSFAIEAMRICKSFNEKMALRDVDLKVAAGETLALFGPNGAGKTNLINILASIMNPSSGDVFVYGLRAKNEAEKIRRQIGIVSHNTFLYDNLTAFENLDFYRRLYDLPRERIYEVSALVGMQNFLHDFSGTLSRGMQQRLAIARALLHKPGIILMDEPETGLDQQASALLWAALKNDSKEKRTVILATHSLERGFQAAERVVILVRGRIVFQGKKPDLDLSGLKQAYNDYTGVI